MSSYQWKKETGYYKKYYNKFRKFILDYYGNQCKICGKGYIGLDVDHVYNDGNYERDDLGTRGGHTYYKLIHDNMKKGEVDRYQLLCRTCHRQKHSRVAQ